MQFLIGDDALIARFAFPNNRDFVLAVGGEVAVQTVIRYVGLRACKPAGEGQIPIQHLRPPFEPMDIMRRDLAPKFLGILLSPLVEPLVILHALDVGLTDKLFTRMVDGRGAHRIGL